MTVRTRLSTTALTAFLFLMGLSASAEEADTAGFSTEVSLHSGDAAAGADLTDLADMSLEELLDTEVSTASKTEEKISDAPGVITVVTKDELRRFGGRTLKDILMRVPSLIASTTSFADRTTIAARGDQIRIDSGHVLVLINGRPTRESLQGGISSDVFEAFPVNIIERIEVIRGPGSVLYGTNAFSAVINVITEAAEPGDRATVTALGGLPGSYGEAVKSTARVGDLGIVTAASFLKRADWKTQYRYSPPDSVDVTVQDVSIPNLRQGAYLGLDYKGVELMSTFNQWDHAYFFDGVVGQNRWRRAFGDLGYRFRVTDELEWDTELHATYTLATMDASDFPGIHRQSHDMLGEWANFLRLHESLRLVAGGVYNHIQGTDVYHAAGRDLTVSDASRGSGAFYVQLDHQTLESLKLIAGLQANAIENIDPDVVPRGGIIWRPIKQINVKGLYGQAFRAPSINEIGLRHPELWGQAELRPEKVQAIDAGVSYLGEQLNAGVNYFYTLQRDIIMVDTSPSTRISAPAYYNNLGEVQIRGVELELKCYLVSDVYLGGSGLYFFSKDGDGNEDVTPIPNLGAKAGVSYMSDNGLTTSVFYIYQGELDAKYSSRLNPDSEAYHLVNAHLSFDVAKVLEQRFFEGLSLFVEGDNLLDQEIFLPDWGGVTAETIPVNPGRTVYFGISASVPDEGS